MLTQQRCLLKLFVTRLARVKLDVGALVACQALAAVENLVALQTLECIRLAQFGFVDFCIEMFFQLIFGLEGLAACVTIVLLADLVVSQLMVKHCLLGAKLLLAKPACVRQALGMGQLVFIQGLDAVECLVALLTAVQLGLMFDSMLDEQSLGGKSLAALGATVLLLGEVCQLVIQHVLLGREQGLAELAGKVAPGLTVDVQAHVTVQVGLVAELLVAVLAGEQLSLGVAVQVCLQVRPLGKLAAA